jgi:hypothetical protein
MNLDEVDQEVRDSLRLHAEEAPSGAGLLDAVRGRSRRQRIRQRSGVVGLAALTALAVALGTPYALSAARHGGGSRTAGAPAPAHPTTTTATTTPPPPGAPDLVGHPSRVRLVTAAFTPITFPLTPTFTPAGLPTPTEGRTVGEVRLVYTVSADSVKGILAAVDDKKPAAQFTPTSTTPITVSGHPATRYVGTNEGEAAVEIVWNLNGKWVMVLAGGLSVTDVERYANGLTEHPRPPTPLPFTAALAPAGYQVDFQEIHPELTPTEFYFNLAAPGQVNNQLTHQMVGVVADASIQPTGTPIQVGAYQAMINLGDDGIVTIYVLRPDFAYAVHENKDGPLSQADLIRFAAGINPQ